MKLIELLKKNSELSKKMKFLKKIDKEVDKYNKIKKELLCQQRLVNFLVEEYKNEYGENLRRLNSESE